LNALDLDSLVITPETLMMVAELDEFNGAWKQLAADEHQRLGDMRKAATIESIGASTRIEGSKMTDGDVSALLENMDGASLKSRDEQEVAGYAAVIKTIHDAWEAISITENHIKQLHGDLLRYADKDVRHRGAYKTLPNHIVAADAKGNTLSVVFKTTDPFATPARMTELVDWYEREVEGENHHPIIITAVFIMVFLAIHPFQDGNGRLSRLLTTLMLMRQNYSFVPYVSLEGIIERDLGGYYSALRGTQTTLDGTPDWQPWLSFFLNSLVMNIVCTDTQHLACLGW